MGRDVRHVRWLMRVQSVASSVDAEFDFPFYFYWVSGYSCSEMGWDVRYVRSLIWVQLGASSIDAKCDFIFLFPFI